MKNHGFGSTVVIDNALKAKYLSDIAEKTGDQKNVGGLVGGLEYTGTKLITGAQSVFEGLGDFVGITVNKIAGNNDKAEYLAGDSPVQFRDQLATAKYNPGKGMNIVGKIATGMGQTATYAGLQFLTAGIPGASFATMATSAAGNYLSEAYQKTGKIGKNEYLYAIPMGLAEGFLEMENGPGAWLTGKPIQEKVLGKLFSKAGTSAIGNFAEKAVTSALGEGFEEGVSAILSAPVQNWSGVDKNAKIDWKQVAEDALYGALSGALLGGGGAVVGNTYAKYIGNQMSKNPNYVANKITEAQELAKLAEGKGQSELAANIKKALDAYNKQSAQNTGYVDAYALGRLNQTLADVEATMGMTDAKGELLLTLMDPEKGAKISETMKMSVEDLLANKDGMLDYLAAQKFVQDITAATMDDLTANEIQKKQRFEDAISEALGGKKTAANASTDTTAQTTARANTVETAQTAQNSASDAQTANAANDVQTANTAPATLENYVFDDAKETQTFQTKDGSVVVVQKTEDGKFRVGFTNSAMWENGQVRFDQRLLNKAQATTLLDQMRERERNSASVRGAMQKTQSRSLSEEIKNAAQKENTATENTEEEKVSAKSQDKTSAKESKYAIDLDAARQKALDGKTLTEEEQAALDKEAETANADLKNADSQTSVKDDAQTVKIGSRVYSSDLISMARTALKKYEKQTGGFDFLPYAQKLQILDSMKAAQKAGLKKNEILAVGNIAYRAKIDVTFVDFLEYVNPTNAKAVNKSKDRLVAIDVNHKDKVSSLLMHEAFHQLVSDKFYGNVPRALKTRLDKIMTPEERQKVENAYQAIGETNAKTIEEEVYAKGIEKAFASESFLQDGVGRGYLGQIWQRFKRIIAWIGGTTEYRRMRSVATAMQNALDTRTPVAVEQVTETKKQDTIYVNNTKYDIIIENDVDVDLVKPASEEESKQLSMSDKRNISRFSNDVEASIAGDIESNKLVLVGKPSAILAKYMNSEKLLYIPQKIIRKIVFSASENKNGKHNLGKTAIVDMLYQLSDPIIISKNTSKHQSANDNSIVVWMNWVTKNNDSIIVPISIDAVGNVGTYNNINSMFDVYNKEYESDLLKPENILYTKNKKDVSTLLAQRRQVPEWKRETSSVNNISENSANVNSKSEKNQKKSDLRNAIDIEAIRAADKEYQKPITVDDIQLLREITKAHGGERVSINDFTSEDIQKAQKWAYKFYKELGTKSPFFRAWFGNWRAYDSQSYNIVKASDHEYIGAGSAINSDTGKKISWGKTVKGETINHVVKDKVSLAALGDIDRIIKNAILFDTQISDKTSKSKMESTAFMHNFYSEYEIGGNVYLLELFVEEALPNSGGDAFTRAYQLKDIEKIAELPNSVLLTNSEGLTEDNPTITHSVSDLYKLVKTYDKNFHAGKEVSQYLLNEDGTPKVFYHGAKKNGGFTEFRNWQYFTDNQKYAERYAERGNEKSLYEVYLSADKIFDTRNKDALAIFNQIRQEYGLGEIQDSGIPDWTDGYDISDYLDNHPELGYDAILLDEGGDLVNGNPVSRGYSIVIKNSNQIKSATDNIGTFDRGNNDIRYSVDLDAINAASNDTRFALKFDENGNIVVISTENDGKIDFDTPDDELAWYMDQQMQEEEDRLRAARPKTAPKTVYADDDPRGWTTVKRVYQDDDIPEYIRGSRDYIAEKQNMYAAALRAEETAKAKGNQNPYVNPKFYTTLAKTVTSNATRITFLQDNLTISDKHNVRIDGDVRVSVEGKIETLMKNASTMKTAALKTQCRQIATQILYNSYYGSNKGAIRNGQKITKALNQKQMEEARLQLGQYLFERISNGHAEAITDAINRLEKMQIDAAMEKSQARVDRARSRAEVKAANIETAEYKAYSMMFPKTVLNVKDLYTMLFHRTYMGADALSDPELKRTFAELSKSAKFGKLRAENVRDAMLHLLNWYTPDNKKISNVIEDENGNPVSAPRREYSITFGPEEKQLHFEIGGFDFSVEPQMMQNIADLAYMSVSDADRDLNFDELSKLYQIVGMVKHVVLDHDKVIYNGKYEETTKIASEAAKQQKNASKILSAKGMRIFNSSHVTVEGKQYKFRNYILNIADPHTVARYFDMYTANGFFATIFAQLSNAESMKAGFYAKWMQEFVDYYKANKYEKRLAEKIEIRAGMEMTVNQAISLYCLWKRPQANLGLTKAGIRWANPDTKSATAELTLKQITQKDIDHIALSFTKEDKQYVKMLENFFNGTSKEEYTKAEMRYFGYTNASEEYYFPIMRDPATIAKTLVEGKTLTDNLSLFRLGMTKNVKEGAQNALYIGNASDVLTSHANSLSTYVTMYEPLRTLDRVMNRNLGTGTDDVKTVKQDLKDNFGGEAVQYIVNLAHDVQGLTNRNSSTSAVDPLLHKLRSNLARAALAANPKVALTQFASYPTAGCFIGGKYLSQAMAVDMSNDNQAKIFKSLDEHSDLARARAFSEEAVSAQINDGLKRKTKRFIDWTQSGITKMDRFTIGRIWVAAQLQIADETGFAYGTEENMQAAAKLFDDTVRLTQPMYQASERSAFMRNPSELSKGLAMFTTVAMKQGSRVFDTAMCLAVKSEAQKMGLATSAEVTSAKKAFGRTAVSVGLANLMYVVMCQLWKTLTAADRDDDGQKDTFGAIAKDVVKDYVTTSLSMFPVVGDIIELGIPSLEGYDISDGAFDMVNDLVIDSAKMLAAGFQFKNGKIDQKAWNGKFRKFAVSASTFLGVPTRNVYNLTHGITARLSPSAGYKWDDFFGYSAYSKDVVGAIKDGNETLSGTIMRLMVKDRTSGLIDSENAGKIASLYYDAETDKKYSSFVPSNIGNTVKNAEEEEITLTKNQKQKMRKIYAEADEPIAKMMQSAAFRNADADAQRKALSIVWDVYLEKAKVEIAGAAPTKLTTLANAGEIEKLAPAAAIASVMTTDKDASGKTINGSRKKKITAYLKTLGLTKSEYDAVMNYLGFTT